MPTPIQQLKEKILDGSLNDSSLVDLEQQLDIPNEKVQAHLLDLFRTIYLDFPDLQKDLTQENILNEKIQEYLKFKEKNDAIAHQIFGKIIENLKEIKKLNTQITENTSTIHKQKLLAINQQTRFIPALQGTNLEVISKLEGEIKENNDHIQELQKDIDEGLNALNKYHEMYNGNFFSLTKPTEALSFHELKFDYSGATQAIANITTQITAFKKAQLQNTLGVNTKALQDNQTVQDYIEKLVKLAMEIAILQHLTYTLDNELYREELSSARNEYGFLLQKTKHVIAFTREFIIPDNNGHELITPDEWKDALEKMVEAQIKLDKKEGEEQNLQDTIKEQKAHLAELIMERGVYAKNEALEGIRKELAQRKRERVNQETISFGDLQQTINAALIRNAYGYAEFEYIEQQGSSNKLFAGVGSVGIGKGNTNTLTEDAWSTLNTNIVMFLLHYTEPPPKPKIDNEKLTQQAISLTNGIPSTKENFTNAVTILKEEILTVEKERIEKINKLYEQYDNDLKTLIKRHKEERKAISLTKGSFFEAAANQLRDSLHSKVKEIDENPKYLQNREYAENFNLLEALKQDPDSLDTQNIIAKFKNEVTDSEQKRIRLEKKIEAEIKIVEEEKKKRRLKLWEALRKTSITFQEFSMENLDSPQDPSINIFLEPIRVYLKQCVDIASELDMLREKNSSSDITPTTEQILEKQKILQELQQKTKCIINFTGEFIVSGNGHELITPDEWKDALEKMVETQIKLDKKEGNKNNLEDTIKEQKAHLAELIMERGVYAKNEALDGIRTQWKDIDFGNLQGIVNETLINKVYGHEAFEHIEVNGSSNKNLVGLGNVGLGKGSTNKLTREQWSALNTGIVMRLLHYSEPTPARKIEDEQINKQTEALAKEGLPKPTEFLTAIELLKQEIIATENERIQEINKIYAQYDSDLRELIRKHHDDKRKQTPMPSLVSREDYILAEEDLTKDSLFKTAAEQLRDTVRSKVAAIDKETKYVNNLEYANNIELLGLKRFPGKESQTPEEKIQQFKDKCLSNKAKEIQLTELLAKCNSDISSLKPQVKLLLEDHEKKYQELISLTKGTTEPSNPAIESAKEALRSIEERRNGYSQELEKLLKNKIAYQHQIAQHHAQLTLEKRLANGLVPPARPDFLDTYKGFKKFLQDHENFANFHQEIAGLTAEPDGLDKLLAYAAEVISILPTIDVPDVTTGTASTYSDESLDNMTKAFVILEQAKKAIADSLQTNPDNLSLQAKQEDINHSFNILYNKILVHPRQEAAMGFALLPEAQQAKYIAEAAKLKTEAPNSEAAHELNEKIHTEVNSLLFAKAQQEVDAQLTAMGSIAVKIKEKQNIGLYNGLVNNRIVLNELLMMQERLEEYLFSNNAEIVENEELREKAKALRETKQKELDEIKKEIEDLSKLMTDDIEKISELLGTASENQDMGTFLRQEALYYWTRMAYLSGGAFIGYSMGKLGGLLGNLLGQLPGYSALSAPSAALPYVGIAAGAWVGWNAGELATHYSDSNLSRALSSKTFTEIQETSETLELKAGEEQAFWDSARQTMEDIRNNYIEGYKDAKNSVMHTIGNFIKNHKIIFWGGLAVLGVVAGLAISAATMGAAAPLVAAVGSTVAITAAVYGGGVTLGVGGTMALGFLFKRKATLSQNQSIHKKATAKAKKVKKLIDDNTLIDKVSTINDENLRNFIGEVDNYLKEQAQLVQTRLVAYEQQTNNDDDEIKAKLMREVYCLQEMEKVRNDIMTILQEIAKAGMGNIVLIANHKENLHTLINNYLKHNYLIYHKPHLVDLHIETTTQDKESLITEMEQRGNARIANKVVNSRRNYITPTFTDNTTTPRPIHDALEKEQQTIKKMQEIKILSQKL